MAIDGFLKIDGIPGESQRREHEDEIEIHGLEFGMAAAVATSGHGHVSSGARTGRVNFEPIRITKRYDRSSPLLKQSLARAQVFREAVIAIRRTVDGETSDYLVVTLTEASTISYDVRPAPEPDVLEETLALTYATVTFRYHGEYEVLLENRPHR